MNPGYVRRRWVEVSRGDANIAVSHDEPEKVQWPSVREVERCEGVPQDLRGTPEPKPPSDPMEDPAYGLRREALPGGARKEQVPGDAPPRPGEVAMEPLDRFGAQGEEALPSGLGRLGPHEDRPGPEVAGFDPGAGDLARPDPGVEHDHDQGPVSGHGKARPAENVQEPFDLDSVKNLFPGALLPQGSGGSGTGIDLNWWVSVPLVRIGAVVVEGAYGPDLAVDAGGPDAGGYDAGEPGVYGPRTHGGKAVVVRGAPLNEASKVVGIELETSRSEVSRTPA